MNTNSLLCNHIRNHPDTWQQDFKNRKITVKKDGSGLAIFKYGIGSDFSDPLVCEARGIIIDLNSLEVAGIGFNKFFNVHEPYASEIDWSTARVQEKLDGSICKLFWNKYRNMWQWATNGTLDASEATCEDPFHSNYLELIREANNYNCIITDKLDKNKTYIFEICDFYNHTVRYPVTRLYHIGTRDNITLKESETDIGIEKPKEYPLTSLKECLKYVETLNKDDRNIDHEGFVVVDGNWNWIKIKNSKYLRAFYLTSTNLTKKAVLRLLETDDIDVKEFLKDYPKERAKFYWYLYQQAELECLVEEFIRRVRTLYVQLGGDRRAVAERIKGEKFGFLGFRALGNRLTASELLRGVPREKYDALIEDYCPRKISIGEKAKGKELDGSPTS